MLLNRIVSRNVVTRARFLPEEQKYFINGFNINTVQVGRGEKTVMLLPGTLGTAWTDFRPQLEGLPELLPNYKIIAWDPPGYGKSVPPKRDCGPDCFQNDAKCAVNVIRALARRKFSILGWSAGSYTAQIIAGRFPEYVDKLVIWGGGSYLTDSENNIHQGLTYQGRRNMSAVNIFVLKDPKNWSQRMREPLEKVYGREGFKMMLPDCMDCLNNFYEKRNGDICCKESKMVKAPTFVLRGGKDPLNSPEHIPYLLENLPCCKIYVFPDGKHNIHLRYSDEFNKMVAEFLLQDDNEFKRI